MRKEFNYICGSSPKIGDLVQGHHPDKGAYTGQVFYIHYPRVGVHAPDIGRVLDVHPAHLEFNKRGVLDTANEHLTKVIKRRAKDLGDTVPDEYKPFLK